MGREVRRVPLDFDWPLNKVWDGFLMPERLREAPCDACEGSGYSPRARELRDLFWGRAPFRPEDNGSTPFPATHPHIMALARRNYESARWFHPSVESEADRLAALRNSAWSYHLNQEDVDALLAAGCLRDLTHTWDRVNKWVAKDPQPVLTATAVNEWNLHAGLSGGVGSREGWALVRARCAREGVPEACASCEGKGRHEVYPGQRAEAEAWEAQGPPEGPGWQLWETVSEGSPLTQVFATANELVAHLIAVGDRSEDPSSRYAPASAWALVKEGWAPSGASIAGKFYAGADALVAMDEQEASRG